MNPDYFSKLKKRLNIELEKHDRSGIYGYTQRMLAYNSNKIEGSTLTEEQTANLFDTGSLLADSKMIRAKDIEEMTGHFSMFNEMLKTADDPLSQNLIKRYHYRLKSGVFEDLANGYPCGEFKNRRNRIGNITTADPEDVPWKMQQLIEWYENQPEKDLCTLADFHIRYEQIHPFQDGNGRTGRILLFKECLRQEIVPFIIMDKDKLEYYHCLNNSGSLARFFEKQQEGYLEISESLIFTGSELQLSMNMENEENEMEL